MTTIRCAMCDGKGRRYYANLGTYMCLPGRLYGQALTKDVCDRCWGSGDQDNPFRDLRKLATALIDSKKILTQATQLLHEVSQQSPSWTEAADAWLEGKRP